MAVAPVMAATAAHRAGNAGARGIADHAAGDEADGAPDQRAGAGAEHAIDGAVFRAGLKGDQRERERRRDEKPIRIVACLRLTRPGSAQGLWSK